MGQIEGDTWGMWTHRGCGGRRVGDTQGVKGAHGGVGGVQQDLQRTHSKHTGGSQGSEPDSGVNPNADPPPPPWPHRAPLGRSSAPSSTSRSLRMLRPLWCLWVSAGGFCCAPPAPFCCSPHPQPPPQSHSVSLHLFPVPHHCIPAAPLLMSLHPTSQRPYSPISPCPSIPHTPKSLYPISHIPVSP